MTDLQKLIVGAVCSFLTAGLTLVIIWLMSVRDFISQARQKEKDGKELKKLQDQLEELETGNIIEKLQIFNAHKAEQEGANRKIFRDIENLNNCIANLKKDVEHRFELLQNSQNLSAEKIIQSFSSKIDELKKER